jgi:hypothetical protein
MSLAQIENPPQNAADKAVFDFCHQDLHRRLIDYLQPLNPQVMDAWVLDPFDAGSEVNVYQHQNMHNQIDSLLNTPNYDMTELTWDDPGSRASWVDNNYQSHLNYAQIVGFD